MRTKKLAACLMAAALALSACQQTIPKEALQFTEETLEERQLQTRRFETKDEQKLITASAQLLQDLGFNLDESESKLGVVVASKERSAIEAGQIVGAIIIGVLFGAVPATDKDQLIRASVVTKPLSKDAKNHTVRVTFQRTVWNTHGQISKLERMSDPEAYQEFFSKLSKAVFLEAHEI